MSISSDLIILIFSSFCVYVYLMSVDKSDFIPLNITNSLNTIIKIIRIIYNDNHIYQHYNNNKTTKFNFNIYQHN
jgi:hypothetical protein